MAISLGAVFITGANRGLGLEMVKQLIGNEKNFIFAACRNPAKASQLNEMATANKNLAVLEMDVVNDEQIKQAVKAVGDKLGYLNVLINNAGILETREELKDVDRSNVNHHFNVNATSVLMISQQFRSLLVKGKEKSGKNSLIVNVGSEMGSITNTTTKTYAYRLSKTACHMATKCLNNELAPEGINCVAIHPVRSTLNR